MIKICLLLFEQLVEAENFLVSVFGEDSRILAQDYLRCTFSDDYRRPEFFIALDSDKIVGSAALSEELFTVDIWGISWVAVDDSYRQQGIGERLVSACCDRILERVKKPVTAILATYPEQTKLYDNVGFQLVGKDHAGGSLMIKYLDFSK
jgi:N-acetylglutamate synthase-like GNAT family acetyltransferase